MTLRRLTTLAASLLFLVSSMAPALAADFVWVTEASSATRWQEKDSSEIAKTEEGQRLELIFRGEERIRVRVQGSRFGWVDAATVSDSDPAAAPGAEEGDEGAVGDEGDVGDAKGDATP